ncbi:chaperonin 10-like protein [Chaetomium strumarium]|uniref:Chaperonin 10-like protein n=1 Tax=Chaetomium strumarium TaxID=1170767 RepID=A0AAJ0M796_9PEZI|nr:chaperonin 10-like protein [Chaetomium strumarium]
MPRMTSTQNTAAWLPGVGKELEVGPADTPVPDNNELLVEVKAVAVQPAEYKIQEGILPFPLKYPTIVDLSFSGVVVKVGSAVTRFNIGDRIVTNSAGTIRNDSRFGGYQRYALTTQELTADIGDVPFEQAASVSNLYGAASALFLHFGLEKSSHSPNKKAEKVHIWGASSSFGAYATQLAAEAGYTVVGVASAHNADLVHSFGSAHFVDRKSPTVSEDLIVLGPFKAVLAAADAAQDQMVLGSVLAAQGGGLFLSTMGLRPGVTLPEGVRGLFAQYVDDYLDLKNKEFTEWLWCDYLEQALQSGKLRVVPVRTLGGSSKVQEAWDLLHKGAVRGERLVIAPGLE